MKCFRIHWVWTFFSCCSLSTARRIIGTSNRYLISSLGRSKLLVPEPRKQLWTNDESTSQSQRQIVSSGTPAWQNLMHPLTAQCPCSHRVFHNLLDCNEKNWNPSDTVDSRGQAGMLMPPWRPLRLRLVLFNERHLPSNQGMISRLLEARSQMPLARFGASPTSKPWANAGYPSSRRGLGLLGN